MKIKELLSRLSKAHEKAAQGDPLAAAVAVDTIIACIDCVRALDVLQTEMGIAVGKNVELSLQMQEAIKRSREEQE